MLLPLARDGPLEKGTHGETNPSTFHLFGTLKRAHGVPTGQAFSGHLVSWFSISSVWICFSRHLLNWVILQHLGQLSALPLHTPDTECHHLRLQPLVHPSLFLLREPTGDRGCVLLLFAYHLVDNKPEWTFAEDFLDAEPTNCLEENAFLHC